MTPPTKKQEELALQIASNVRSLRLEAHLSLAQLAERMGTSESTLSKIENGKLWKDRWIAVLRLSEALGCRPRDLFSVLERE